MVRRVRSLVEWQIYRRVQLKFAEIYRPRLNGVTFVGVTGSAGKTSATAMIAAILRSAGKVKNTGSGNRLHNIARIITATRPSDDFCVLELGAERQGYFDPMVRLLAPTIGVVTTVGDDHHKAFGSREAIAAEKGKLIAALAPDGTAVLNADDPLVWAMGEGLKARVIGFGLRDGADLQARDIRSSWPERLSFTVRYQGFDYPVRTQLCGKHWVTSTLAALATGVAAGVPLAEAVKRISQVPPPKARMEPVSTPDGITFVRDDWKASFWGMPTVFEFLRDAEAVRKVLVLGTLSDYEGSARIKYRAMGQEALKVADVVFFVGKMATSGLRARKFAAEDQILMAFPDIREASAALEEILRPGDLVFLKGSGPGDHLGRLYHARTGPVACWRRNCGKITLCDGCALLRPKQGEPTATFVAKVPETRVGGVAATAGGTNPIQVFVGIGNPGEKYRHTPHNVGFTVLDILAERHGLAWERGEAAEIARLVQPAGDVLLVKPQKQVNNTGKALLALAKSMGFSGKDVVLVQDDINLPLGTVRTRLRGSDGGHLGIRSALVAFQTSDIPRVKIGVGSAAIQASTAEYLVSPFSPSASAEVYEACEVAVDRLLAMAGEKMLSK
ncbi:MAG: aminoacyl-tRNA hydrolase [Kiloniellaceae bacterium]